MAWNQPRFAAQQSGQFNYMQYQHQQQQQQLGNFGQAAGYAQQHYQYQTPTAATSFPPHGVHPELWQWFQSVDQDRNGRITIQELQRALLNGNWSPFNEETCRLMVGMFDRDRSGTIDIREFEALWKYIQEWKRCFDGFDRDRSGTIDANELHLAFQTFGYRLTPGFSGLIIRRFDRQGRNSINFDDFIQACVMLHILTEAFRIRDTSQSGTIRVNYEQFLEMVMDTTIRN